MVPGRFWCCMSLRLGAHAPAETGQWSIHYAVLSHFLLHNRSPTRSTHVHLQAACICRHGVVSCALLQNDVLPCCCCLCLPQPPTPAQVVLPVTMCPPGLKCIKRMASLSSGKHWLRVDPATGQQQLATSGRLGCCVCMACEAHRPVVTGQRGRSIWAASCVLAACIKAYACSVACLYCMHSICSIVSTNQGPLVSIATSIVEHVTWSQKQQQQQQQQP
jgi:hypothetical protein